MKEAKQSILIAAQYLFATQKSFSESISDRMSTSFDWTSELLTIQTKSLTDEGASFGLNLEYFSIDVLHPEHGEMASYPLANANHLEILNWIGREKYLLGIEAELDFQTTTKELESEFHDRYHHSKISKEELANVVAYFQNMHQLTVSLNKVFDSISALITDLKSLETRFDAVIDDLKFSVFGALLDDGSLKISMKNSEEIKTTNTDFEIASSDSSLQYAAEFIKKYVSEILTVKG